MKILVTVRSTNNAKTLRDRTLTWAPRAGYNFRVIIPDESEREAYEAAVQDAAYHHYLDITTSAIVVTQDSPQAYAKAEGYDLLVAIPDDLRAWKRNRNRDKMIIDFAADIGAARSRMGKEPELKLIDFPNGAIMKRL